MVIKFIRNNISENMHLILLSDNSINNMECENEIALRVSIKQKCPKCTASPSPIL